MDSQLEFSGDLGVCGVPHLNSECGAPGITLRLEVMQAFFLRRLYRPVGFAFEGAAYQVA
jgi:hypothetical protein